MSVWSQQLREFLSTCRDKAAFFLVKSSYKRSARRNFGGSESEKRRHRDTKHRHAEKSDKGYTDQWPVERSCSIPRLSTTCFIYQISERQSRSFLREILRCPVFHLRQHAIQLPALRPSHLHGVVGKSGYIVPTVESACLSAVSITFVAQAVKIV